MAIAHTPAPGSEPAFVPPRRLAISSLGTAATTRGRFVRLGMAWAYHALTEGADALLLREARPLPWLHALVAQLAREFGPETPLGLNPAQPLPPSDVALFMAAGLHFLHHKDQPGLRLGQAPAQHHLPAGQSVHSPQGALQAAQAGAAYVTFSPVFPTSSHPGVPAQGLPALQVVCQACPVPVLALGGVTATKAAPCRQAGSHGWAAIGAYALPAWALHPASTLHQPVGQGL